MTAIRLSNESLQATIASVERWGQEVAGGHRKTLNSTAPLPSKCSFLGGRKSPKWLELIICTKLEGLLGLSAAIDIFLNLTLCPLPFRIAPPQKKCLRDQKEDHRCTTADITLHIIYIQPTKMVGFFLVFTNHHLTSLQFPYPWNCPWPQPFNPAQFVHLESLQRSTQGTWRSPGRASNRGRFRSSIFFTPAEHNLSTLPFCKLLKFWSDMKNLTFFVGGCWRVISSKTKSRKILKTLNTCSRCFFDRYLVSLMHFLLVLRW